MHVCGLGHIAIGPQCHLAAPAMQAAEGLIAMPAKLKLPISDKNVIVSSSPVVKLVHQQCVSRHIVMGLAKGGKDLGIHQAGQKQRGL